MIEAPNQHKKSASRPHSILFVSLQFILIFAIALHAGVRGGAVQNTMTILAIALGVWAITTMRLKVNVFPDVRTSQRLYTGGPYRFIRHPMYTSVLLATLAWVLNSPDTLAWVMWLALLINLLAKLRYEEMLLKQKFPDYKAYALRTKRLLPFLY